MLLLGVSDATFWHLGIFEVALMACLRSATLPYTESLTGGNARGRFKSIGLDLSFDLEGKGALGRRESWIYNYRDNSCLKCWFLYYLLYT